MPRGPKKHLKRLAAPKSWMLGKLGGVFTLKPSTDPKFPTGFMDVVQIEKTGENFRIIYDVKGRFTVHRITASEAAYKLCRVRAVSTGPKGVPYLHTSDGRTIRYPDPNAKVEWFLSSVANATSVKCSDPS